MKTQCYFSIDETTKTIIAVASTKEVVETMTKNYQQIFKIPKNKIGIGSSEGDINTTWKWLKRNHS